MSVSATPYIVAGVGAMFVFAVSKRWWLALLLPCAAGLSWTAYSFGAFGPSANSTTVGFVVGWSPIFLALYFASALVGLAVAFVLERLLSGGKRRH
jgi:hypothetical protein